MKKSSIKILYRLFAFLSDKTNGFAPFVKYKLTLGAVLIGLGACSNSVSKKQPETKSIDANNQGIETTICYTIIEQQPSFPGGNDALLEFIQNNLRYPKNDSSIQGRVIVNFVIEKDGTISDINVIKSLNPNFDKEAVRIIQLMPKWTPGKQRGKEVRVRYTLPISFKNELP